jgi:hypothetical protein
LAAGYSNGHGGNCAVIATGLLRNPKVVDAMFEVGRLAFRARGPAIAAEALLRIAQGPSHKDRARASIAILDRTGMGPTLRHEVEHTHIDLTGDQLIERIRDLAHRCGLDAARLIGVNTEAMEATQPAIEAEFEVVNGAAVE